MEQERTPTHKFALHGSHLRPVVVQSAEKPAHKPGKLEKFLQKIGKKLWRFRKIIAYSIVGLSILATLIFLIFYYLPVTSLIRSTNELASSDFNDDIKNRWAKQVLAVQFLKQSPPLTGATEGEFAKALLTYTNNLEAFNSANKLQLPQLKILGPKETQVDLNEPVIEQDPLLPEGLSYDMPARSYSFEKYMECKLEFSETVSPELKFLLAQVTMNAPAMTVKGKATPEQLIIKANEFFSELKLKLSRNERENVALYLTGDDLNKIETLFTQTDSVKLLEPLKFFGTIEAPATSFSTQNNLLGKLPLVDNNNKELGIIQVFYDRANARYQFDGIVNLLPQLLVTPKPTAAPTAAPAATTAPANITQLQCTDCWLAPVDKSHQLKSNYAPKVSATGLNGGGSLTVQASVALKELFTAFSAAGINPRIISAYRSYSEQTSTFNYWVQRQINASPGISRAEAEQRANRVSAKPGHSEHQLGTTVDLKCASCGDFDNSEGNLKLYQFLKDNAHKYGFVISYPDNTEALTGYKQEPWHIRYIGKELASEMFATGYTGGNGNYPAKFLLAKKLY